MNDASDRSRRSLRPLRGVGLWLAAHCDTGQPAATGPRSALRRGGGLLLGLAQLRAPRRQRAPGCSSSRALPIAVAAGWVLVVAQPDPNGCATTCATWSADLGIADVVHYVAPYVAVLAFGIGLVFGLTLLAGYVCARR